MARLDYIDDFSPSTNTSVSYVTDASAEYFVRIGNESTHNYKAGIWFDLSTIAGWSIIANYEIENSNGNGNTDNLYFSAGWVQNRKIKYALNLKGKDNIATGLEIVKNINGFDIKFNADADLTNKNQNSNIYINKLFWLKSFLWLLRRNDKC